jgi:hypothetical protein
LNWQLKNRGAKQKYAKQKYEVFLRKNFGGCFKKTKFREDTNIFSDPGLTFQHENYPK